MLSARTRISLCLFAVCSITSAVIAQEVSVAKVREAMDRAARFFGERVAVEGGYVWDYSTDFKERRGEGPARPRQNWVQPPGTPSVGEAFLRAYERTGDEYCLQAAKRAAHSLAWGQLSSGGWDYSIDFDPERAGRFRYRRDLEDGRTDPGKKSITSTFDDDTSQSALCLLIEYDRVTRFTDETVHRAARFAIDHFLKVQRPNGGWPQRFIGPCDPAEWPARNARYPDEWSRTFAGVDYRYFYTLNDHVAHDLIRTLLLACDVYGDKACLDAALRTGDFFIAAQLPEPQPTWAQQYNAAMEPAWARKFEPPAAVSYESVSVARSLGELYVRTGEEKYRKPIGPFLDWLDRSRLPDGQHARFCELRTNKPLYFTRKYELVYTDDDMPTHYSFKSNLDVAGLRRWYEGLPARREAEAARPTDAVRDVAGPRISAQRLQAVLRGLDDQGRWIDSDGKITSQTFIRNLDVLSGWLAHAGGRPGG